MCRGTLFELMTIKIRMFRRRITLTVSLQVKKIYQWWRDPRQRRYPKVYPEAPVSAYFEELDVEDEY